MHPTLPMCHQTQNLIDAFYRFLLLTGQRREETANMRREDLEGAIWTIPAGRAKKCHGRDHDARCEL